ncbi:MAG: Uncharacterised protein [Hyphomonas sp. TMED17]|nr:MAG: Uncharacterised protein [Hyphomonas sp. TMED17]
MRSNWFKCRSPLIVGRSVRRSIFSVPVPRVVSRSNSMEENSKFSADPLTVDNKLNACGSALGGCSIVSAAARTFGFKPIDSSPSRYPSSGSFNLPSKVIFAGTLCNLRLSAAGRPVISAGIGSSDRSIAKSMPCKVPLPIRENASSPALSLASALKLVRL